MMKPIVYVFECGCRSLNPPRDNKEKAFCSIHKTNLVAKEVTCLDCPTIFLTSHMANNVLRCPPCALKQKKKLTTKWHERNPKSWHKAAPKPPEPIEFKLGMVSPFPMGFSDEDINDIRSYEDGS